MSPAHVAERQLQRLLVALSDPVHRDLVDVLVELEVGLAINEAKVLHEGRPVPRRHASVTRSVERASPAPRGRPGDRASRSGTATEATHLRRDVAVLGVEVAKRLLDDDAEVHTTETPDLDGVQGDLPTISTELNHTGHGCAPFPAQNLRF